MREKILITVKTYPVLSRKYAELVCTAGVNEAGEWRRIYPIQFRQLREADKYKKYQWVEAELIRSSNDSRPESRQIDYAVDDPIRTISEPLSTANKWLERRQHFVDKVAIYDDMQELITMAHGNKLSLALFCPKKWNNFVLEETEREWSKEKIAELEKQRRQFHLFEDEQTMTESLKVVNKLPYKFSYKFEDIQGKESTLMIEDWEIGALYWNCLRGSNDDESKAASKVRQKYWGEFIHSGKCSPLLVLGTTLKYHNMKSPNPFVIIGVVPLPEIDQAELGL